MKLTAIYGPIFVKRHGVKDNGTWFRTLQDLTPRALEFGVDRLMKLIDKEQFCEFPPNCLQFKRICLGFYEQLGLPSAPDAYREIKMKAYVSSAHWSHPAVRYTAFKLGASVWKTANEAKAYALFKKAYEQVSLLVRQGFDVPEVTETFRPTIPEKNSQLAQKHLNAMRQQLGAM